MKIVQRLPVRIELTDYDAEKSPLFVGLSVVPYVYYRESPTGPNAGKMLQPTTELPRPVMSAAADQTRSSASEQSAAPPIAKGNASEHQSHVER